jgi:hypothetical protein
MSTPPLLAWGRTYRPQRVAFVSSTTPRSAIDDDREWYVTDQDHCWRPP